MNLVFVDYVEEYYSNKAESVPDKITGKFVQIKNNQIEYFVLSPKELTQYHANIVEKFCMNRGLNGAYAGEEKRFDIREPGWKIAGGGKFEMDRAGKKLRLYDNSLAYGRFDSKGLAEKIRLIAGLSDYQVVIY